MAKLKNNSVEEKNVTPVTVLQMKYMGPCPKCLGVYRGTVGQTTSSGKVGEHEICP